MTHAATQRNASDGCNPGQATLGPGSKWSDARRIMDMSIREFAEATGINRGDLSKIENGIQAPTPDQARRILFVVDAFAGRIPWPENP